MKYEQALRALELDPVTGQAPSADWRPDPAVMKNFLRQLRRLICQPTAGLGPRDQGGKNKKDNAPRTLEDVLDDMVETNASELFTEQRAQAASLVHRANLQSYDAEDCLRFEKGAWIEVAHD